MLWVQSCEFFFYEAFAQDEFTTAGVCRYPEQTGVWIVSPREEMRLIEEPVAGTRLTRRSPLHLIAVRVLGAQSL